MDVNPSKHQRQKTQRLYRRIDHYDPLNYKKKRHPLHAASLEDLDPISIWVVRKRQPFHAAFVRLLLEPKPQRFQDVARSINIVDQEAFRMR